MNVKNDGKCLPSCCNFHRDDPPPPHLFLILPACAVKKLRKFYDYIRLTCGKSLCKVETSDGASFVSFLFAQ